MPISEDRTDRRIVARMDIPSSCQMERPRRSMESVKPRRRTKVRGAIVLAFYIVLRGSADGDDADRVPRHVACITMR